MSKVLKHLGILAAYLLLTLAFAHPLFSNFSTKYLGKQDVTLGIWNLWHFRYALTRLHINPLWTDFQYWPYGTNLILHHYTLAYDAAGFFLQPWIGLPATYNLLCLLSWGLAGWAVYLIARDWGAGDAAAFVAGAAYAFSPAAAEVIEDITGMDYMSIHTLPFFLWTLLRAVRGGKAKDAFWAALCLTWVWLSNYYYFLFCSLLIPLSYLWLKRPVWPAFTRRTAYASLRRALEGLIVLDLAWLVYSLIAGGGQRQFFHGQGNLKYLLWYTAPYLLFWFLLGLRLLAGWRAAFKWDRGALAWKSLKPYAALAAWWALLNVPVIATVFNMAKAGALASNPNPWRGGGNPTELLCLLLPSFFHPLWGHWAESVFELLANGEPLRVSLGFVPLAAVYWLWRRRAKRQDEWVSLWLAGFVFSVVMTLGPWLKLFGFHTYLPLPFYFMHLLPIFSSIQTGFRFGIFAALFSSLLLGACLKELRARYRWAPAAAFVLLALEFAPRAFTMQEISAPPLFHRLADRQDGALLPVPVGAIFNGLSAHGAMGLQLLEPVYQTVHHKPTVGGYLTRVSRLVYERMQADPFISDLIAAQEGAPPSAFLNDVPRVTRYLREMRLHYVLVSKTKTPEALKKAVGRWPIRSIDEDESWTLYEVL